MMITKRQLFALTAAVFCLLLSFRPIPDISDLNDTGRYVLSVHNYCKSNIEETFFAKDISYSIFHALTSPATCLVKSDVLFLFEVASFLPLIFLLFAKWQNGTFLWACSLMFSVAGLELMTNAMRQNFAMLVFFGAISLVQRHQVTALLVLLIALAAHISVVAFLPFFIWLSWKNLSTKMMQGLLWSGISILFMYYESILEFFNEWTGFFSAVYAENLTLLFTLFMTLPLYWFYGLRYLYVKENISSNEKKAIVYSTGVLFICFIMFPSITYRYAIFATALQIFLLTRSESPKFLAGGYALIGSLVHLAVMLAVSNHYEFLING